MVEEMIKDDSIIKIVKTEFTPVGLNRSIKIQHNLDKNAQIEEGYIAIPEGDKIVVDGKEFDLMGLRRQIEWMFGNPLPKKQDEIKEETPEDKPLS